MEASRRLISPSTPPPVVPRIRHQLRSSSSSSSSVPMLHDQASRRVSPVSATSVVRHFPASVLSKEQRDDYRNSCFSKEDKSSQTAMEKLQAEIPEEMEKYEFDQYLKHFERQLLYEPGLWNRFPDSHHQDDTSSAISAESVHDVYETKESNTRSLEDNPISVRLADAVALAKRAVIASKKAASLVEKSSTVAADINESYITGFVSEGSIKETSIEDKVAVRSKQLLERRSRKRKVARSPSHFHLRSTSSTSKESSKKIQKSLDSNDPLRLFLWGPVTKKLLTLKEEKDLFVQIQDLMRLEEVQQRLQLQFDREPTLAEWAEAVGMTCEVLQSCISSGKRSRDRMIYANFRLVVHVARHYEGKGLNLQDLLQEGSRGLVKSLQKFKPKAGCRFPTYAYWWIRQSIRKAIFQHSRTIRLPENIFALLKKVKAARRLCAKDGRPPSNEEIAKFVGITNAKLENLLRKSRNPVSLQKRAWLDQDVTFQEITADPEVELPDLIISKGMMRQHVCDLLNILPARERQIIQYRFGIDDNGRKSLTEIGIMFGLSKERIRQLESRALDKLKKCLPSQELEGYMDLLI